MLKKLFIGFLIAGAVSMIVMSFHYFLEETTGILKGKEAASQLWYQVVFRVHVMFGLIAILTGPFQFIHRFRERSVFAHRRLGYVYVGSVLLSSMAGLAIARFTMGGWIPALGFTVLSILWAYITIRAVYSVIRGNLHYHQAFMIYSYSLTFAAITQRTMLLIPLLTSVPFFPVYRMSAWLPWIINLGIAHLIITSSKRLQWK